MNIIHNVDTIYDVIFFWDQTQNEAYKQYVAETFCNILGFTPSLSVKIVFDASEKGKTLIMSTRNIEKATEIRDKMTSLNISCQICPVTIK